MFERKVKLTGLKQLEDLIDKDSIIQIFTTDKYNINRRVDLSDVNNHLKPEEIIKWFYFGGPEGLVRANIVVGDKDAFSKGNVVLERNLGGVILKRNTDRA